MLLTRRLWRVGDVDRLQAAYGNDLGRGVRHQFRAELEQANDDMRPGDPVSEVEAVEPHDQECATSLGRCAIGVARRLRNL